jgi:hypothetical protein
MAHRRADSSRRRLALIRKSHVIEREEESMPTENWYVSVALNGWKQNLERAEKVFQGLSKEQLQKEISPGKNRLMYIWGHLTAVHDMMLPLLGFGPRLHPEFDAAFISNPDKSQGAIPSTDEIRKGWTDVNSKLAEGFAKLTPAEWLQRHSSVSVEDFAKEPWRNRFAILLSRTNHLSYHLGQVVPATK